MKVILVSAFGNRRIFWWATLVGDFGGRFW